MKRYKKLTILHSNDMHWDFFAEEENAALVWGISRLSGYINKTKEEEKNCIYTISGDMFQGSVIDNEFKGISTIDIMNMLNPDVVTLWNHEIDYWLAHLLFLEKIAMFPIINSNLYIKPSQTRLFKPYYIKEIDGMKVLFIWIITEEILSKVAGDPMIATFVWVEEAAREVEKICNSYRATDIDCTVLLTHIWYENDLKLAKLLNPELWVDIIIWGHSHTLLQEPTKVNDILVTQVWVWTDHIWRFDIVIDTKNNNIKDFCWKAVPITDKNCPRDKKIEKILHWYKDKTDAKYGRILSKMKRDLTHPERERETEVWNLFADILKDSLWLDIMCLWSGSMRNDKLESIVTLWELKEMYPYWGKIYALKISWKELRNMIKFAFSFRFNWKWEESFQWSKWINIVYNKKKDEMKRMLLNWRKIDKDKIYTLWLQKFQFDNAKQNLWINPEKLSSGKKPRVVCTNDFDILEEYFTSNQNIDSKIEGRIVFK